MQGQLSLPSTPLLIVKRDGAPREQRPPFPPRSWSLGSLNRADARNTSSLQSPAPVPLQSRAFMEKGTSCEQLGVRTVPSPWAPGSLTTMTTEPSQASPMLSPALLQAAAKPRSSTPSTEAPSYSSMPTTVEGPEVQERSELQVALRSVQERFLEALAAVTEHVDLKVARASEAAHASMESRLEEREESLRELLLGHLEAGIGTLRQEVVELSEQVLEKRAQDNLPETLATLRKDVASLQARQLESETQMGSLRSHRNAFQESSGASRLECDSNVEALRRTFESGIDSVRDQHRRDVQELQRQFTQDLSDERLCWQNRLDSVGSQLTNRLAANQRRLCDYEVLQQGLESTDAFCQKLAADLNALKEGLRDYQVSSQARREHIEASIGKIFTDVAALQESECGLLEDMRLHKAERAVMKAHQVKQLRQAADCATTRDVLEELRQSVERRIAEARECQCGLLDRVEQQKADLAAVKTQQAMQLAESTTTFGQHGSELKVLQIQHAKHGQDLATLTGALRSHQGQHSNNVEALWTRQAEQSREIEALRSFEEENRNSIEDLRSLQTLEEQALRKVLADLELCFGRCDGLDKSIEELKQAKAFTSADHDLILEEVKGLRRLYGECVKDLTIMRFPDDSMSVRAPHASSGSRKAGDVIDMCLAPIQDDDIASL